MAAVTFYYYILIYLNPPRDGIGSWGFIMLEFTNYKPKEIIMQTDLKSDVYLKRRENLW